MANAQEITPTNPLSFGQGEQAWKRYAISRVITTQNSQLFLSAAEYVFITLTS